MAQGVSDFHEQAGQCLAFKKQSNKDLTFQEVLDTDAVNTIWDWEVYSHQQFHKYSPTLSSKREVFEDIPTHNGIGCFFVSTFEAGVRNVGVKVV